MFRIILVIFSVGYALGAPSGDQQFITENLGFAPKITHGEDASEGQFPFVLSLNTEVFGHVCGASILTNKWILTTASCCLSRYPLSAFAGTIFLNGTGQVYDMIEYVIPGDYDPNKQLRNNICLGRINGEIQFSDRVQQVTLPPQDWTVNDGDLTTIVGWGYIKTDALEMSNTLQVGYNFSALTNDHCGELTELDMYDGFLCAQGQQGQGICTGDSGNPLIKGDVQVGISSLYFSPCGSGKPDIYTRVPSYIDWIKKELGDDAQYLKFSN